MTLQCDYSYVTGIAGADGLSAAFFLSPELMGTASNGQYVGVQPVSGHLPYQFETTGEYAYQGAVAFPQSTRPFITAQWEPSWANEGLNEMNFYYTSIADVDLTGLIASPSIVTLGDSVFINTTITGSTNSLSYTYSGLPSSGCQNQFAQDLYCTPPSVGTYNVSVKVSSSQGGWSVAGVNFSVVSNGASNSSIGVLALLYPWGWIIIGVVIVAILMAVIAIKRRKKNDSSPPGLLLMMCPYCNKAFDTQLTICPHCGQRFA